MAAVMTGDGGALRKWLTATWKNMNGVGQVAAALSTNISKLDDLTICCAGDIYLIFFFLGTIHKCIADTSIFNTQMSSSAL